MSRLVAFGVACRDFKLSYLTISRPRANHERNMSTGTEAAVETNVQLPNLSAADFRVYNHMAEHMEYYVSKGPLGSGRNN